MSVIRALTVAALTSAVLFPQSAPRIESLSLHDRIAQLIVVRGYGDYPAPSDPDYVRFLHWIQDDRVGGFIVAGHIRNGNVIPAQPFEMATFLNHMQTLARMPLLVASDFERGASMRVANTAHFPYQMAFGAARDLNAVHEFGAATAREARALGVNWVFAPDADVNNNPANPVINTRSFGEDPNAVAGNVAAFIDGAHSAAQPILLSAKHFPGHGDTAEDSHMQLARLDQPKERIESLELVPFRAAIAHGVDSIMTAHLAVPALEPQPIPATVSHNILTNLLRDELNFKGIIVTDAMEMKGVALLFSEGEAAVRAIEAGADVLLMPTNPDVCIQAIMSAVASGRLSASRIDQSVSRILAAKQNLGLFENKLVDVDRLSADLDGNGAGFRLAQTVANEAVTLVKDEKHLFPLRGGGAPCLVILGEGAFALRGETLARYLKRKTPALKIFPANSSMPDSLLSAYASQASACKQIYVAAFVTVEASRGSVNLEGGLNGLLRSLLKGPAPVALISFGNPYLFKDFPEVSAYAATFSTADTSELAAAQAILGEIGISGKLPVSIPGLAKIGDGLSVPARAKTASNGVQ